MFRQSDLHRRTRLSVEPLEVRLMLTSTKFAVIGDYGNAGAAELGWLINRESDPDWALTIESATAPYNPARAVQQDFIVGVGDSRYYAQNTYAAVHGNFCNYLTGVEATDCNSYVGLSVSNDSEGVPLSDGDPSTGKSAVNRFFPAPGNHDYSDDLGIVQFQDYFDLPGAGVESPNPTDSELYYDVVQGPVHLFFVDSQAMLTSELAMETQTQWLENGVRNSTARWQVVVMHHPPYSSDTRGPETGVRFDFADWGTDLVLTGDRHVYERIERVGDNGQQTTFIVNGLGGKSDGRFGDEFVDGSQMHYEGDNGAAFFIASETHLSGYFKTTDGVLIDSFSVPSIDGLPCEHTGDGDGCDIEDIDALYASFEADGIEDPERKDKVVEWLDSASSAENTAKDRISDVYTLGDVDLNGVVDSVDLGLLLNSFNFSGPQSIGWGSGDLDGDDDVDSIDLGNLLNNFSFGIG